MEAGHCQCVIFMQEIDTNKNHQWLLNQGGGLQRGAGYLHRHKASPHSVLVGFQGETMVTI